MVISKFFGKQRFLLTSIVLLGAAGILSGCSPKETPAPVATVECPTITVPTPVSFDDLWKSSPHANKSADAFTHWDTADPREIPAQCAKCHSRTGFLDFLGIDGSAAGTVDRPAQTGTTITCYVCHNEETSIMDAVTFPSGNRISGLNQVAQCVSCHQGRASTETVNDAIVSASPADDDASSAELKFVDSHSISGATSFGTEAQGAYEYAGNTYQGRFLRGEDFFTCVRCHDQHSLKVKVDTCRDCHTFDGEDVKSIRVNSTDFDGDGDTQEGIAFEVDQIHQDLYAAIQAYARNTVDVAIVYDVDTYPYFFIDSNNDGKLDPDEANFENQYNAWTPRLLRAAYNYNYVSHDPGAFAHNSIYTLQVLYDSLADIGGNLSGLSRP